MKLIMPALTAALVLSNSVWEYQSQRWKQENAQETRLYNQAETKLEACQQKPTLPVDNTAVVDAKPHSKHRSETECRITWTSLMTGKHGHGVWLPEKDIRWQSVDAMDNSYPEIHHNMECRQVGHAFISPR